MGEGGRRPGEGFKSPWPPLIKMDEATRKKIDALFTTIP
jgi:methyl coenzyme M reductase gamma subunit